MTPPGTASALAAVALCVVTAGCADSDSPHQGSIATAQSTAERGPVKLSVRAEPGEISVGQRLRLVVEVVAAQSVEVQMPAIEDPLGEFAVRSRHTPPDVPEGSVRRFEHVYELDTFASGRLEIPPLVVRFRDKRPQRDTIEGEVESSALSIEVRSVLAADEGPGDYRDIKSSVEVPVPALRRWWPAWLVLLAALATAAVIVAVRYWRRTTAAPEVVVPAHVWALKAIGALEAEALPEQGLFQRFYFALSDIVRQYIERRFGMMAPERTTEEFLRETRTSPVLIDEHKTLLAGFLRAADMVKFALHRPTVVEAEEALAAARRFVEQTIPATTPQEVAA